MVIKLYCLCSTDIDECERNPCIGGDCVNTQGSYICQCRVGYQSTATRTECRGNGLTATSAVVYVSGGRIVFKQHLTDGSNMRVEKKKKIQIGQQKLLTCRSWLFTVWFMRKGILSYARRILALFMALNRIDIFLGFFLILRHCFLLLLEDLKDN